MAGEDDEYLRFVRSLPCLLAAHGGCIGATEAHHAGRRETGDDKRKAHDHTAIPLCHGHHIYQLHGLTGYFKGWHRDELREWAFWAIEATRKTRESAQLPRDSDIPF